MTLEELAPGIHAAGIGRFDGIVFDCDGVLVDVSESYDEAIRLTARHVLGRAGIRSIDVDPGIIEAFKSSGGFNDEVDLAYAAIISLAAAERSGRDPRGFVLDVAGRADHTGIRSVEQYVRGAADISDIITDADHPGSTRKSPLYDAFDQIFYGEELYREMTGRDPGIGGAGLIGRDRVILDGELLDELQKMFGSRIAMVTGRGMLSARHSLGRMLDRFDLGHSAFLEDHPRELAKPNPEPLVDAVHGIGASSCLYVGDSMEDLIMAERASEAGARTAFCGITGTSGNPAARLEMFRHAGAHMVLDSIRLIPKALNLEPGPSSR